jgi:DNA-binding CsgD family transcriptional regulator
MTTILSIILAILAILLIPAIVLGWLTESRTQRIRRLSRAGMSQRKIAQHMGISRHRVKLALTV